MDNSTSSPADAVAPDPQRCDDCEAPATRFGPCPYAEEVHKLFMIIPRCERCHENAARGTFVSVFLHPNKFAACTRRATTSLTAAQTAAIL